MKKVTMKRMYLFGISLSLVLSLFAQKPIEVKEITCKFSHGEYPGVSLVIPEAKYDDIAKEWTKRLEKGTKSALTIDKGEYSIFGAQIQEISENPVNVYSILHSQDSAVLLEVSIELKPKEFLSKAYSEQEYAHVHDYLFQFGKEEYTNVANGQLNEEENKLKALEKELSSLQNAKSKLEKDIVEENNNILNYEDQIELLRSDASNLNEQIGQERKTLLGLKDEEAQKVKEKQIKDLEKDKDKMLKDVENYQKKIVDSKSNINTAEMDIETNINEQQAKTGEIQVQKRVLEGATIKLNTIMSY
jgi:DNA repair exonuclease SbcCD ATPase subunit